VQQPFVYHLSTAAEVQRLAARSHAKDRVIIEPFAITLVRPDGSSYAGEATTIPYYSEQSRIVTGSAPFSIGTREAALEAIAAGAAAARAQEGIAWGT